MRRLRCPRTSNRCSDRFNSFPPENWMLDASALGYHIAAPHWVACPEDLVSVPETDWSTVLFISYYTMHSSSNRGLGTLNHATSMQNKLNYPKLCTMRSPLRRAGSCTYRLSQPDHNPCPHVQGAAQEGHNFLHLAGTPYRSYHLSQLYARSRISPSAWVYRPRRDNIRRLVQGQTAFP